MQHSALDPASEFIIADNRFFSAPAIDQTTHIEHSSPAKLILSGEHAIIYQSPALSLPIPLFSTCLLKVTPQDTTELTISLLDLNLQKVYPRESFIERFSELQKNYQQFIHNTRKIQHVLDSPVDLVIAILGEFQTVQPLPSGDYQLTLSAKIPMARGLGSSASMIISTLNSLQALTQQPFEHQTFLKLAQRIEAYQHGHSSGIDPATIYLNQAIEFCNGQIHPISLAALPKPLNAWLIDSGQAECSTGETVKQVRDTFATDQNIWQQFSTVTEQIKSAWQAQHSAKLLTAIQQNQRLLTKIGVIPKAIQTLITQLEHHTQGAAKVCGAGAICGEYAGVILLLSATSPKTFCEHKQLKFWKLAL